MIFTIILARLVGPEAFGIVAQAAVYMVIVGLLLDQGFSSALIQRPRIAPELPGAIASVTLAIGVVLTAATLAAAPAWAAFMNTPELSLVLTLLAPSLLLRAGCVTPRALLLRSMAFRRVGIAEITGATVGGALGVTVATLGAGYWALVVQLVTTDAVLLVMYLALGAGTWPNLRISALGDIVGFSVERSLPASSPRLPETSTTCSSASFRAPSPWRSTVSGTGYCCSRSSCSAPRSGASCSPRSRGSPTTSTPSGRKCPVRRARWHPSCCLRWLSSPRLRRRPSCSCSAATGSRRSGSSRSSRLPVHSRRSMNRRPFRSFSAWDTRNSIFDTRCSRPASPWLASRSVFHSALWRSQSGMRQRPLRCSRWNGSSEDGCWRCPCPVRSVRCPPASTSGLWVAASYTVVAVLVDVNDAVALAVGVPVSGAVGLAVLRIAHPAQFAELVHILSRVLGRAPAERSVQFRAQAGCPRPGPVNVSEQTGPDDGGSRPRCRKSGKSIELSTWAPPGGQERHSEHFVIICRAQECSAQTSTGVSCFKKTESRRSSCDQTDSTRP